MARRRKKKNNMLVYALVILCIAFLVFAGTVLMDRMKDKPNENAVVPNEQPGENNQEQGETEPENQGETEQENQGETNGEGENTNPTVNPEDDERFFDTESYLIVANKKHPLPEGYVPSDLMYPEVPMRYNEWQLRQEAAEALEEMFEAASREGLTLICGSGYRHPDFQGYLYDNYVANYGKEAADTFSARPGYSDHQTGLATDLCGPDETYDLVQAFEETAEGKWLKDHAHEFGFIMRYPKGKEEITGYMYEPWHFRYIGVEEATAIYSIDPFYSFEEYYGIEGGDYVD